MFLKKAEDGVKTVKSELYYRVTDVRQRLFCVWSAVPLYLPLFLQVCQHSAALNGSVCVEECSREACSLLVLADSRITLLPIGVTDTALWGLCFLYFKWLKPPHFHPQIPKSCDMSECKDVNVRVSRCAWAWPLSKKTFFVPPCTSLCADVHPLKYFITWSRFSKLAGPAESNQICWFLIRTRL